ncbi:DUF4309 domain-containing protein [Metabacillus sp. RGM 3146]|uniref:DUF4309 domain-containing protein n=1 Tax=Metabacillus sp. RGM 3146 TaxID=3401092 RepID=UPI003B9B6E86
MTGTVFGTGTAFGPGAAKPASELSVSNTASVSQLAVEKLKSMYKTSLQGEFSRDVMGLKVGKSTKSDVYKKIGAPPMHAGKNSQFDIYTADMGHPGYAFAYNKDKTIKEIRYLGTNVERQTSLGGITTYVIGKFIGKADQI